MLRSDLLKALSDENPGLTTGEVERIVDVFFDEIARQLADSGRVEIRGFGVFSTAERIARPGRNPRTGEIVRVPSRRVPKFKLSKSMTERLNAGK